MFGRRVPGDGIVFRTTGDDYGKRTVFVAVAVNRSVLDGSLQCCVRLRDGAGGGHRTAVSVRHRHPVGAGGKIRGQCGFLITGRCVPAVSVGRGTTGGGCGQLSVGITEAVKSVGIHREFEYRRLFQRYGRRVRTAVGVGNDHLVGARAQSGGRRRGLVTGRSVPLDAEGSFSTGNGHGSAAVAGTVATDASINVGVNCRSVWSFEYFHGYRVHSHGTSDEQLFPVAQIEPYVEGVHNDVGPGSGLHHDAVLVEEFFLFVSGEVVIKAAVAVSIAFLHEEVFEVRLHVIHHHYTASEEALALEGAIEAYKDHKGEFFTFADFLAAGHLVDVKANTAVS